jgi:phenylacetate-CoA ligase
MNKTISKYFFYLPVTVSKGEMVLLHLPHYRKSQFSAADDIERHQNLKALKLFEFAQRHSLFYRDRVAEAITALKRGDSLASAIQTVPYMTKQDLIRSIDDLATYVRRWSSSKTTGGSTGEPVRLFKNPDALARERAATWRAYEWANVSIGDKQARFWGVPHSQSGKLKASAIDTIANRFRISAFNLTDESLDQYYKKLVSYRPDYLYGYVSVIDTLATHIESRGLAPLPGLRAIITTSEVLTAATQERLKRIFGVNVFNEYGCGEVGSIAHQCEHGSMHIMADNLFVEIDSTSVNEPGEIVVTDLFNYATPLIRYRLGDYASRGSHRCACGRTLPTLDGIHGRAYDIIKVSGGKGVHPEAVMYIFEDVQQKFKSFKHFQAIQDDIDHFTINIVPTEKWEDSTKSIIDENLRKYISPSLKTSYSIVTAIPREKSGKMRVIKSTI